MRVQYAVLNLDFVLLPSSLQGKEEGEEGEGEGESLVYELFSVVVHSGSTHSGHYTALIRDVDNLGNWTHPVSDCGSAFVQ